MSYWEGLKEFFQYDFLIYALIGTILLSLLCGLLSPLVLAKKYAFIGEGVSHSTLVGLAVALGAFHLDHPLQIFFITLLITLFLVALLARSTFQQGLPSDSLIGIFLTTSLGLGVLLHSIFGKSKEDLLSFLFGNILLLETWDLLLLFLLCLFIFPLILIPLKKWIYIIYDEEGARVAGLPLKKYHYLFFFVLTILIVSAIKIAGTVLVNTLLLIPGALSYKLGKNMKQVFFISMGFSLGASLIGLSLANWKGLPPGATLALTQFFLFLGILFITSLIKKKKHLIVENS